MILYIAFLGAVMNKIRGGTLTNIFHRDIPFVKIFNDLVFASIFTYIVNGGFVYRSETKCIFIALFLGMLIGRSKGWGCYIGGMIFYRVYPEEEVKWIDRLVMNNNNHPVIRNCIALSLRGLMWTVPLAIAFWICSLLGFYIAPTFFGIIPLGLLMGPVYLFTIELCERVLTKNRVDGWQWGELFWGFILWGGCALMI